MRAQQFIKDHGLEKAREVVEGAPKYATHFKLGIDGVFYFKYFGFSWFCFGDEGLINTYMDDHESCHLIEVALVKRLVESVDRINASGGIYGFKTYCNGDYQEQDLLDIRNYESIYGEGNE
ncbi:hypothetical protein [Acinetobacter lactucae]|uniref:hypothetical protein n=1 Tax=Acinetobacter lactucae TaxID=1785128 RepID=UPI001580F5E2|nr:hypothetical protein [Acinetobacter lactucae]NUG49682.1 hypothetical protein [Acinetobacter lactucae]